VGARRERLRRALEVGKVARRTRLLKVLKEIGVAGDRPATPEAAREFRCALEELGTTYSVSLVAGLLLASAWMARVNDALSVVGFLVASALGLYMLWKIFRTPGSL
jgi:hypothetical protein